MALAIQIKIIEETDDPIYQRWLDIAENPPKADEITYIRMPGTSQSGPCAECAQYFLMEHDGSGREVPIIPVHINCVCSDIIKEFAETTIGEDFHSHEKGEWLTETATEDQRRSILGIGRAALLEFGAVEIETLYKRQTTPRSDVKTLAAIARGLVGKSRRFLMAAAERAGLEDFEDLSQAELINALIGRDILD